jgi:hypothetical protein
VYLAGGVAGGEFVVSEKYFLASEILSPHAPAVSPGAFFYAPFLQIKN